MSGTRCLNEDTMSEIDEMLNDYIIPNDLESCCSRYS